MHEEKYRKGGWKQKVNHYIHVLRYAFQFYGNEDCIPSNYLRVVLLKYTSPHCLNFFDSCENIIIRWITTFANIFEITSLKDIDVPNAMLC